MKSLMQKNSGKNQTIATNLKNLFEKHNVDANIVAEKLGIPMMTVRRLMIGETKDPRISTLKLIANYFEVSVDSLIDSDTTLLSPPANKPNLVPIFTWEEAEKFNTNTEIVPSAWGKWQSVPFSEESPISKKAFALESRPSMYARFPQSSIFIIEPELKPRDGDIVLVKIKATNELTLRELTIDPPEWQLQPVIPGSNILYYSRNEHEIVGINLMTLLHNRKN